MGRERRMMRVGEETDAINTYLCSVELELKVLLLLLQLHNPLLQLPLGLHNKPKNILSTSAQTYKQF